MKKIISGLIRKTLVFALAFNVTAAMTACSSGGSDLETFAPAESRTFAFESEDMPKIKENPTVAPLEETAVETTAAAIAPETTVAETAAPETTEAAEYEVTYPDAYYRVQASADDFYLKDDVLRANVDVRTYIYFEKSYIDSLGVGSVIPLSNYGLEDILIEYVFTNEGSWYNVDDTYFFEPDPDGSDKWVLCEMNDIPIYYISHSMDVAFAPDAAIVDNFIMENKSLSDPADFFAANAFLESWPATMAVVNNQIISFEYEYRP